MDKFIRWDRLVFQHLDAFVELVDTIIPFSMKTFAKILCVLSLVEPVVFYREGIFTAGMLVGAFLLGIMLLIVSNYPVRARYEDAALANRFFLARLVPCIMICSLFYPVKISDHVLQTFDLLVFWLWVYTNHRKDSNGRKKRVPLKERLTSWFRQGIVTPLIA